MTGKARLDYLRLQASAPATGRTDFVRVPRAEWIELLDSLAAAREESVALLVVLINARAVLDYWDNDRDRPGSHYNIAAAVDAVIAKAKGGAL